MKKNLALVVAGLIFLIVAIAHIFRIYMGSVIVVGGMIVPMMASYVALVVALVLSIWMFMASRNKSK